MAFTTEDFMARIKSDNPTYERVLKSDLHDLVELLKVTPHTATAQQIAAEMGKISDDKWNKYARTRRYILTQLPEVRKLVKPPAELVNITEKTPKAVQIWGFYYPCTANDVSAAVAKIAKGLTGTTNVIHIMSGTHGCCAGEVGAGRPKYLEPKFLQEDKATAKIFKDVKTKDGKPISIEVHDFNTKHSTSAPDDVTKAMSKLNQDIRSIVTGDGDKTHTFILAYCCSAGTEDE